MLFEKELTTNVELKNELEIQKFTNELISLNEEQKIFSSINQAKNNYLFKKRIWNTAIASAIIIGLSGLTYFMLKDEANTTSSKKEETVENIAKTPQTETKTTEKALKDSNKTAQETITTSTNHIEKVKETIAEDKPSKEIISTTKEENQLKTVSVANVKENKVAEPKIAETTVKSETKTSVKPCATTVIQTQLKVENACLQLNLGELNIINSTGGKAPYQYKLYLNNKEIKDYSQLEVGNYTLVTTDFEKCTQEQNILIKELNCPLNYDFNPSMGQEWDELTALYNGKISITHAKSGTLISEFKIEQGEKISWDGKNNLGDISLGFHIFVIQYANNKVVKGKITVSQ